MTINIEDLIRLVDKGLTTIQIAKELNISRSTVVRLKKKFGLKSKINQNKKIETPCIFCGIVFQSFVSEARKFCSSKCSATYNNLKKSEENIIKNFIKSDDKFFKKCQNCSILIEIERSSLYRSRKYCSILCQKKFEKKLKFDKIEKGEFFGSSKSVKKYLIEKHGEKCMKCGWSEKHPITNNVPIELEHKDGNSENNNLENLELLCPNCHSLTPTFKALNKGNGRHKRRERYQEGKSY